MYAGHLPPGQPGAPGCDDFLAGPGGGSLSPTDLAKDELTKGELTQRDRLFMGARGGLHATGTERGRYFFDRAPCQLINASFTGQLNGAGAGVTLIDSSVSGPDAHPWRILLRGGSLSITRGLVSGHILAQDCPVRLDGCRIWGDVRLDHDRLQLTGHVQIQGTVELHGDAVTVGPGCRIDRIVLHPRRSMGAAAQAGLPRITLHPGACVEATEVRAPRYEVAFVTPGGTRIERFQGSGYGAEGAESADSGSRASST